MPDGTALPANATKEQVIEAHNGLIAQVRGIAERTGDVNLVKAVEDFRGLQTQLRELAERDNAKAVNTPTGKESNLTQFVHDGKPVFRALQINPTTKQALPIDNVTGPRPGHVVQRGLLDPGVEVCGEWHAELRRLCETRTLARYMVGGDEINKSGARATPVIDYMIERHLEKVPETVKRIFSGASGSGSDWQQTDVLPTIIEDLRMPAAPVEDVFEVVPMARKSLVMPFTATLPRAYRYGTPSGNNPNNFAASDIPTSNRTMTTDAFAVSVQIFEDAEEDAIIDLAPMLNAIVTKAARYNFVDAVINGDTNGQDTLTSWNPRSMFDTGATFGGTDDPRKAFIGLRAYAFDASATRDASSDTTWSTQTLLPAMSALKAPHGVMGDLVYLTSPEHFLGAVIKDSNLLTMEKYGPNATILKGEVGMVFGRVKVLVSDLVTADLAATGLYTGSGSYTSGILFNRQSFVVGERKAYTMEMYREVRNGVRYLILTFRKTFKSRAVGSTDKVAHVSYKL